MRALIVLDNLNTGGIATSLYNLLENIGQQMDCDLLIFDDESIDESRIPKGVRILESCKPLYILGKRQKDIRAMSRILAVIRVLLFGIARAVNGEFARKLLMLFVKKTEMYDVAISYAQDDSWKSLSKGCNDYVRKRVNARVKISYVHCDYLSFGGGSHQQEKGYNEFDYIVCVSESCKLSFERFFPQIRNKCRVCENFVNKEDILRKSEESVCDDKAVEGQINFVTVSRLSGEKGLERGLEAFSRLIKDGITNFTWTIIGDGFKYDELKIKIDKYGLYGKVFLLGNRNNPFPYLKNSSVFLLTSYNEAAPMVFGESAVLHIPIATTETCSSQELVAERGLGVTCDNSQEGIYTMIRDILTNCIDLKDYINASYDVNCVANNQLLSLIDEIKLKIGRF